MIPGGGSVRSGEGGIAGMRRRIYIKTGRKYKTQRTPRPSDAPHPSTLTPPPPPGAPAPRTKNTTTTHRWRSRRSRRVVLRRRPVRRGRQVDAVARRRDRRAARHLAVLPHDVRIGRVAPRSPSPPPPVVVVAAAVRIATEIVPAQARIRIRIGRVFVGVGCLFVPRLARMSRCGGGRRPSVVGLGNVVAPAGRGDRHANLPPPRPTPPPPVPPNVGLFDGIGVLTSRTVKTCSA